MLELAVLQMAVPSFQVGLVKNHHSSPTLEMFQYLFIEADKSICTHRSSALYTGVRVGFQ